MNEPYDRCRVARLCEYARRLDAVEWTEQLELWQVAPDRVLLSAVQVLPDDQGTHEVWLSTEATTALDLENAMLEWSRARGPARDAVATASRRCAATLARWQPGLPGLPHTGAVDEAAPRPTDRSAASR
jgi:hypothetical protein